MIEMPPPEQIEKIKIASQLMGYYAYPIKVFSEDKESLPYPIFTTEPIDADRFEKDKARYEFFELPKIMVTGEWNPLVNLEHAKQLEKKLLKEGKYNSKLVNYLASKLGSNILSFPKGTGKIYVTYADSLYFLDTLGQGKTEQEAIVDAAAKFVLHKERRDSAVIMDILGI